MVIIGNKYEIKRLIGSGSFGKIYEGINIRTKEELAIKIEPIHLETNSLKYETKIYQYLNGTNGIASLKWYGTDMSYRYMVITLLGDSLSFLTNKYGFFSLEVTFQIALNSIDIIQSIHDKGLIHRDIKPDNFLFGKGANKNKLNIIDFGICKRYTNDDGKHNEFKKISKIIGSLNYCSINAHELCELSRRDDLESLGYILIYLSSGQLPWENLTLEEEIGKRKKLLTSNIKIPGIEDILITYLNYVKKLEFTETPDYDYIKKLFDM